MNKAFILIMALVVATLVAGKFELKLSWHSNGYLFAYKTSNLISYIFFLLYHYLHSTFTSKLSNSRRGATN